MPRTKKPIQKEIEPSPISKKKKIHGGMRYCPAAVQLVRKQLLTTGSDADVIAVLGITRSTYYTWIKKYPEFAAVVSCAREDRQKFRQLEFAEETVTAFRALEKLITGYEYTTTTTKTKTDKVINEETGEEIGVAHVVTEVTETEHHIKPEIKAIEKILGQKPIWYSMLFKNIEDFKPKPDEELYKYVFGSFAINREEVKEFKGIYVLSPMLDMIKLRYQEGQIQSMYDQGNIDVQLYNELTNKARHELSLISKEVEGRAQKLLDNKSYAEILYDIEMIWKVLIETVSEVLGNPVYQNGFQPVEVVKGIVDKVNERREKQLFPIKSLPQP